MSWGIINLTSLAVRHGSCLFESLLSPELMPVLLQLLRNVGVGSLLRPVIFAKLTSLSFMSAAGRRAEPLLRWVLGFMWKDVAPA